MRKLIGDPFFSEYLHSRAQTFFHMACKCMDNVNVCNFGVEHTYFDFFLKQRVIKCMRSPSVLKYFLQLEEKVPHSSFPLCYYQFQPKRWLVRSLSAICIDQLTCLREKSWMCFPWSGSYCVL